jgi:DNA-binding transcriptional LysR family regulator
MLKIVLASRFLPGYITAYGGPGRRQVQNVKTTIDSQHLRVYATLARTANLTRAAEELQMTPSGVSHCLKALEADLGCRLFDRNSRKFVLSQAGREFLGEGRARQSQRVEQLAGGPIADWRQQHRLPVHFAARLARVSGKFPRIYHQD